MLRARNWKVSVDGYITASQSKLTVEEIDQYANSRPAQKGAEVFGTIVVDLSRRQNARKFFVGYFEMRIKLNARFAKVCDGGVVFHKKCGSPHVSKGVIRTLDVTPLLTCGLPHSYGRASAKASNI